MFFAVLFDTMNHKEWLNSEHIFDCKAHAIKIRKILHRVDTFWLQLKVSITPYYNMIFCIAKIDILKSINYRLY